MSIDNVQEVFYLENSNTLKVVFKGGSVTDFHPINPETYTELIRSESLYRMLHKVIRKPNVVGVAQVRGH